MAKVTKRINSDNPEYIGNMWINRLIDEIDAVEADIKELSWYSNGGSVLAGWQFAEYLQTNKSEIVANVTGIAASMGAVLLPFFNSVKGAKQSWVMIHSPIGGSGGKQINTVRKQLKDALLAKIDDVKFKNITGVTISEAMDQEGEERRDYWLTGQEAFDIGLYDELYDITPLQEAENRAKLTKLAASAKGDCGYVVPERVLNTKVTPTDKGSLSDNQQIQNSKKMDLEKLKAENPAVYSQVLAEGKALGIKAENDRVGAYMAFNKVDAEAVSNGIKSGEAMSETLRNELLIKLTIQNAATGLEDGSPTVVIPAKAPVAKTEVEKLNANVEDALGDAFPESKTE
jgi:ATP-dependent protease ClpP protease subunit